MVSERLDVSRIHDLTSTAGGDPTSERQFLRFGAACAVGGGLLAVVFNALHPRSPDISSVEAELRLINDNSQWLFVHMGILASVFLIFPGLVALARSLDSGASAPWSRLALYSAVASIPVALITVGIDGIAMDAMADSWANAADQGAALSVADAVAQLGAASFDVFIIALFGVTPLAAGAALLRTDLYPRWLGPVAIVAGLIGLATGFVQSFTGLEATTANVMFPISSVLFTVVILVAGVTLWRRTAVVA